MKRVLVILLFALAALPAQSSKIIGNGGDVSVCPNRSPKVQLLDFVESRALRSKTIKLWNPPGKSYAQKLQTLNARIEKRFPRFATLIQQEIGSFEDKSVKKPDIELEDINDSYHKLRLPGCHVEQIANQSVPMFEDDPWFLINANLWNQLAEFDKAGLVMHEILYRVGLRHGVEHSIGIRYLVSLLFQEKLEIVADRQWIEAFMHSRIQFYEVANLRFPLFHGNEKVCEVVPGTVQCKDGDPEFKPAYITFNPDRSVSQVSFEGIGPENFSFTHEDFTSTLNTDKISFDWSKNQARIIGQGRLQLRKGNGLDVLLADVRGTIDPRTGAFNGEYKIVKPDMTVAENWTRMNGNLKELYALRPPWTDFGIRQPR